MNILKRSLFDHWRRKLVSLILAISLWLVVNQSLKTTKILDNIAVRVINIPAGMTIDGLLPSNILSRRISISVEGDKNHLQDLSGNDLEIVLDATDKADEWTPIISRKNLISLNPDIDLSKVIQKVHTKQVELRFTKLVTEKIPIIVTHPIGEAPRDYQFLDIWPYRLSITVSGPEEKIKQVKAKGINLTFNLNNIPRDTLEKIDTQSDELAFIVPDEWKHIELPSISDRPLFIDDPQAQELRIDFIKADLHPLSKPVSIALFFPPEESLELNPTSYSIALGGIVDQFRGIHMIKGPLFAKGASRLFVELVQDLLQISILIHPKEQRHEWCIQFQNPRVLEDRYVSILLSDEENRMVDPAFRKQREEYLRHRFRGYMNHLQLFKSPTQKLDLKIKLDQNHVCIHEADLYESTLTSSQEKARS